MVLAGATPTGPETARAAEVARPSQILDAVFFYVLKRGCQWWRMLPSEFPPWKMVFHYFRAWRQEIFGVEVANRSPKPPPEKILRIWAGEWFKDDREMDLKKLPKRPAFENLPRR